MVSTIDRNLHKVLIVNIELRQDTQLYVHATLNFATHSAGYHKLFNPNDYPDQPTLVAAIKNDLKTTWNTLNSFSTIPPQYYNTPVDIDAL